MSDARAEILSRIAGALGRGATGPPGAGPMATEHPSAVVPRRYLGATDAWETDLRGEDLVALLTARVRDYRATVTTATPADVGMVIAALLRDSRRVVAPHGLDATWLAPATAAGAVVEIDDPAAPLGTAALDAADAVVTSSRLAIAETGTIVLDGSPDQGRRALSLVPDHHVCVVHAADVVRGLPAAVRRLDPTRPLTWISGPSATSDIELDRVEGVHGPRRLDVVLLRE